MALRARLTAALRAGCPARPLAGSAGLPLVAVIDMENRDGSIYSATGSDAGQIEAVELAGTAQVVYTGANSVAAADPALLARAAGVLLRRCPFGPAELDLLPACRVVVRMGAGYDNLDTAACAERGLVASNCPDAWTEEVADSSLGLLLGLVRGGYRLSRHVQTGGGWTRQAGLQTMGLRRLRGLRLGLVGLGRIGTAMALRARALGMSVSFFDPFVRPGMEKGLGGLQRAASFGQLLAGADAVSFHCPLSPDTKHMFGQASLEQLRADGRAVWLVNAARGGVVDEAALIEGLADGTVAGAGLDALEDEPRVRPEILQAQAEGLNLVVTPHAAFYSDEAFVEMRHLAAQEVGRVLRGEPPHYRVN